MDRQDLRLQVLGLQALSELLPQEWYSAYFAMDEASRESKNEPCFDPHIATAVQATMCCLQSTSLDVQTAACACMQTWWGCNGLHRTVCQQIGTANGLDIFRMMLASNTAQFQEMTATWLGCIDLESGKMQGSGLRIAQHGIVQALVDVMGQTADDLVSYRAGEALEHLLLSSWTSETVVHPFVQLYGLTPFVDLLASHLGTAVAVLALLCNSSKIAGEMMELGVTASGLPLLMSAHVGPEAAKLVTALVRSSTAAKKDILQHDGVQLLEALLKAPPAPDAWEDKTPDIRAIHAALDAFAE